MGIWDSYNEFWESYKKKKRRGVPYTKSALDFYDDHEHLAEMHEKNSNYWKNKYYSEKRRKRR